MNLFKPKSMSIEPVGTQVPVIHLDGKVLRGAFESMAKCAEKLGGMETLIEGLEGKSMLFDRTFGDNAKSLVESEFLDCCAFMPTVRRRIKSSFAEHDFSYLADAIRGLLTDISVNTVDERIERFTRVLAVGKKTRWPRDLAAEILHFRDPETYPLMTRWVWDHKSNTGILREIWYSESELKFLDIPDGVQTHIELRRELDEFLKQCGVFADRAFVIDYLFAWIYSEYIGSQGGSFLKTEYSFTGTPFGYALRMLGLDSAIQEDGKTRLLLPGGKRYRLSGTIDAVVH